MKLLINTDIRWVKDFADAALSSSEVQAQLEAWAPLPDIFSRFSVYGGLQLTETRLELVVLAQKVTLDEEDMASVLYALSHVFDFGLRYSSISTDQALVLELLDVKPTWG